MLTLPLTARAGEHVDPSQLMPAQGLFEIGVAGGVFMPNFNHELYDVDTSTHKPLRIAAADVALRLSYFPKDWIGVEAEGNFMPARTRSGSAVNLWQLGAHLMAQMPGRATPFIVLGYGMLAVGSNDSVLGTDADGAFHWGVGAKYYVTPELALRVDGRHIVSAGEEERFDDNGGLSNHFEVLGGLSVVFNRPPPPDPDPDKDGVPAHEDKCPTQTGVAPDGCPIPDTDGDGLTDDKDKCKDVASKEPDGCPVPDTDQDGFLDNIDKCKDVAGIAPDGCPDPDPDKDSIPVDADKCPTEAGVAPDGCPIRDADTDGVLDDKDQCKDQPETRNGFQDGDGCPDELPKQLAKFTGAIKGINFATGSAKVAATSNRTLDEAVKVLAEFPELRVEISGHTDDQGPADKNRALSQERAEAVKAYFVSKGIAAERLEAKGLGPDQPIADNKTPAGRAQNRRIEFKLIQ